jgi:hypothetical protein
MKRHEATERMRNHVSRLPANVIHQAGGVLGHLFNRDGDSLWLALPHPTVIESQALEARA